MNRDYAGDVAPDEAFTALKKDPRARLVDVRTRAEWTFVGTVDLNELEGKPLLIEWQSFPGMGLNEGFAHQLKEELAKDGLGYETNLYFMCRSGGRSAAAAKRMTSMGYASCYNIVGGFEGSLDDQGHRGRRDGWQGKGLPWIQS